MLNSYLISRKSILSDPIDEMKRIKEKHVSYLYGVAVDREKNTFLNGKPFAQSPRIFGMKSKDEVHTKIKVETVDKKDRFEVGDYLTYQDKQWLCVHSYIFHDLYCTGEFQLCNREIFWLNRDGKLCSQWCVDINTTQYNSGEFSDKYMTVGSTQHQLKMQCNEETVKLNSPKRFLLDKNIEEPTCYKVTQNDTTSAAYGKGLCLITVYENGRNTENDKLITLEDGRKIWIADYFESAAMDDSFESDSTDNKSNILSDITPKWEIESDFIDDIYVEKTAPEINIIVKNNKLDGKSFILKLCSDNTTSSTASIVINIENLI